jgi:hypothetical protein
MKIADATAANPKIFGAKEGLPSRFRLLRAFTDPMTDTEKMHAAMTVVFIKVSDPTTKISIHNESSLRVGLANALPSNLSLTPNA